MKNCSTAIPIQTPVRTTLIESVFDYCRIAYDVLPQEAQLSIALGLNDSTLTTAAMPQQSNRAQQTLQFLNSWDWSQQSFLYVCHSYHTTTAHYYCCCCCCFNDCFILVVNNSLIFLWYCCCMTMIMLVCR